MTGYPRTVLVVNPNTNVDTTRLLVDVATPLLDGSGLVAVGITADQGPRMITAEDALRRSVGPTVAAASRGAEEHRPAAVIVGAFGDPGVSELATQLEVPVVGIGSSAIQDAARGGRRFAVATTTPGLGPALEHLVAGAAPGADFAGLFYTDSGPLDLAGDPDATADELGRAVDRAVAARAETVVIGGGPLSDAARRLARRTDVRIVQPVPSAVRAVLHALRLNPVPG